MTEQKEPYQQSEPDHANTQLLRSQYFNRAMLMVDRETPDMHDMLAQTLTAIDQQGQDNLSLYQSETYPGVSIPATSISVNAVRKALGAAPISYKKEDPNQKLFVYAVFPGVPLNENAATPYMAWDMAIDQTIRSLNITEHPVHSVFSIGSPLSPGGQITHEWADKASQNALTANGKIYADVIVKKRQEILEETGITPHFIFTGLSYGGAAAKATAAALENSDPSFAESIRLLIDNPAGEHASVAKGAGIAAGFFAEGAVQGTVREKKIDWQGEGEFVINYTQTLKDHGIKTDYSPEQQKQRSELRKRLGLQIVTGNTMDQPSSPTYVRTGVADPTSISLLTIRHFRHHKDDKGFPASLPSVRTATSRTYPVATSHTFERNQIGKWVKSLRRLNK
jgi:hypothetical protein